MLTEKDYCDYETCVALKDLEYNRGAYAYYFPNHKEDLIFNTHPMRGCSINEMVKGYNTYSKDTVGHELIDAPTMWEAQKWLREVKKIDVGATWDNDEDSWFLYIKQMGFPDWSGTSVSHSCYSSYEEALSEGIKEAVEILKEDETIHG